MIASGQQWAAGQVEALPPRWQSRLMGRWNNRRHHPGVMVATPAPIWFEGEGIANLQLRATVDSLAVVRIPLDASDSTICQAADALAARCKTLATTQVQGARRSQDAAGRWVLGEALPPLRLLDTPPLQRAALGRIALEQGIDPPIENPGKANHVEDLPAIKRMCDAQWWRRKLRAVHAKHVEGAAIGLGYVNKKADPYVSAESVLRRAQQNERNAAALEATTATNEDGDEYTLAELAAKGPANKAIRRAELMTRIAGFERIADEMGHVGVFYTVTCPSRMHKWRVAKNGQVLENPRYDGTLPNEAQQHLARVWARTRSKLQRLGIAVYGFRIAEPNHDGTPHWHCLVFVDPARVDALRLVVRHYALQDSGTEPGADVHRVDWKPIDKGRGSAAGYIAKYVAKNIDGYRLDKDLIGNDAVETSHRVEAWASTWRIRQFQQIGGPPVSPWRELRRVESLPSNAPAHLVQAHTAANRQDTPEGVTDKQAIFEAGAKWDKYVQAQGGPTCGRRYAIRVEKTTPEGENKYGEQCAPVPMGISTLERYQPEHMTAARMGGAGLWAERRLIVESARYVWTIAKKAAQAIGRVFNGLKAQLSAPWTCVNNCTGESENDVASEATKGGGCRPYGHSGMGGGTTDPQNDGWGLCPAPC